MGVSSELERAAELVEVRDDLVEWQGLDVVQASGVAQGQRPHDPPRFRRTENRSPAAAAEAH